MTVLITPDNSVALPDTTGDDKFETPRQAVEVSAATALVMEELGMAFDMTEKDEKQAAELFNQMRNHPVVKEIPNITQAEVAAKLGAFVKAYDQQIVVDAVQMRTAVTNKLISIADCGDPRYELKALELLGKISDVGLFTEKSEITIKHTTTEALELAIREKVKRLIHSNTIDVEPLVDDLEAELGLKEIEEDASPDDSGTSDPSDDTAQPS
jgi:hypothetical protein